MSYIPKYVLKRMFPNDCMKKVAGGIEVTMINVISPITAKEMPANIGDFLLAKVDGKPVPKEVLQGLVVRIDGKNYSEDNLCDLNGQTLPVGGTLTFFVPYDQAKQGEQHEIELDIKSTKFQFKLDRVVQ